MGKRSFIEGIFMGCGLKKQKPKIAKYNQYVCINKRGEIIGKLKAETLHEAQVGFACRFKNGVVRLGG
jgi:hypothetical protein